ncbi:MAG: hypothetical protein WBM97_11220 [Sedimenticolaceae bacterium]
MKLVPDQWTMLGRKKRLYVSTPSRRKTMRLQARLVLSYLLSKQIGNVRHGNEMEAVMDQHSKDALMVWAGTFLGAAGGWYGSSRLAATYASPLGSWGPLLGGLIGAMAGATLTKTILSDPGAVPQIEIDEA